MRPVVRLYALVVVVSAVVLTLIDLTAVSSWTNEWTQSRR
jgi:hypothetical protein